MRVIINLITVLFLAGIAEVLAKDGLLPSSFKATFEQRLKSEITGKEKVSSGEIYYEFPTHLRFEIKEPDPVTLVVTPEKTWYYTAPFVSGEPGELIIKKSSKSPVVYFFDELHKGSESSLYKSEKGDKRLLLKFSEKGQKETGVLSAEISYQGETKFENIQEVLITHTDKKNVRLSFKERTSNLKFDAAVFNFVIPPKTNIRQE